MDSWAHQNRTILSDPLEARMENGAMMSRDLTKSEWAFGVMERGVVFCVQRSLEKRLCDGGRADANRDIPFDDRLEANLMSHRTMEKVETESTLSQDPLNKIAPSFMEFGFW